MTFDTTAFAELSLPDSEGADYRLGDLWSKQRHVVLFLRHFG